MAAVIGMGGAPLGNLLGTLSEAEAAAAMEAAWDAGIRHYDTAPHYGAGLSEHRMGAALRDRPRGDYVLSTKVGRILVPVAERPEWDENFQRPLSFTRRVDFTHDGCLRSIEDSLQRLGLSRVDIAYIHDCAPDWLGAAWEEQFEVAMTGAAVALTRLREEGVISAWGFGVNVVEPCVRALERAEPNMFLVAGRYTLLDHGALDRLLPLCEARGARVVIGGPYNSGILAGGENFNYERAAPEVVARAQRMGAACERHGVSLKAAALRFCAAHPAVGAVIPGARSAAEASENAALMRADIPVALWAELKRDGLLPEAAPTPG